MGSGLSLHKLQQGLVTIRSRRGSENIKLDQARPHQRLRNLLPQGAVPPWHRALMPLLFCDAELVWVPGVATASDYVAKPDEEGVLVSWKNGTKMH